MKRYYKLLNLRAILSGFSALLLLASCSSYQYAGYDNDGIYSSSGEGEAYTANDYEESYENALYYKRLFAEKSQQFDNVPEEGAIFTDIEGYSSTGEYDDAAFMEEGLDYQVGRAAWGSDPDRISINIYNDYNPFYNPYIHPFYAGFYDPFWGPYYDYYAYRPFGYGYPYGYSYYNSWRWNFGWGWGYGYGYRPYHPYYYYGHRYHYPSYNYRDVAYSSSRRNSYSDYNSIRSNRTDARSSRVQSYSNPNAVRAVRTNSDPRTYQTRSTRVRSSSSDVRRNSEYNPSREVRQVRSTGTRRSNTSAVRTSRSSSSNNVYRSSSSSSSSRSTGTSTRSSRGRGNN